MALKHQELLKPIKPLKLMGKKRGMTNIFDEKGNVVVCTVIEVEPNVITQIKTKEKDGYSAIQVGFDEIKTNDPRTIEKRVTKPLLGHFKKGGNAPYRILQETRLDSTEEYAVGQKLGVSLFKEEQYLDATAFSIGKGYQGPMKLHNFAGMPASHGTGPTHRHLGSTGCRSTPGRCFPGGKRASHMGYDKTTVMNLKVVMVDEEENIIVVKGAVPGPRNGIVTLKQAMKKQSKKIAKKGA